MFTKIAKVQGVGEVSQNLKIKKKNKKNLQYFKGPARVG
jgi:hypothetical protein